MAKTYRMSRATRLINSLFRTLTRFGLGASYRHILTVLRLGNSHLLSERASPSGCGRLNDAVR